MAYDFDRPTDQFLSAVAPVTGPPLTMAGWFNVSDINTNKTIACLVEGGTNNDFLILTAWNSDKVNFRIDIGATSQSCETTTSYTAGTWHHACGVAAATDDRAVYLNGGGKNSVALDQVMNAIDELDIGAVNRVVPSFELDGAIAEVGVWNVALTDAEVATLAAGYSPLLVRPQGLVFYAPIIRELIDKVGGVTITNNNGATVVSHPRVLYPATPSLVATPAAVAVAIASQRLKIGHGR